MSDLICSRLAEGVLLTQILKAEGMPTYTTVMNWLRAQPAFLEAYTRARKDQMDFYADDIIQIAEDSTNDWVERETADGRTVMVVDREVLERSKMRIEARKWLMGKLAAAKYGDKLQLSNDPDNPVGDKHLTVIEVKVQLLEGLGLKKVADGSGG